MHCVRFQRNCPASRLVASTQNIQILGIENYFELICLKKFVFQGFITMDQFRGIIAEVDPNLTEEDLNGIIAEIDEDGSGTMDFDEFCEMMMTSPEDEQ